MPHVRTFFSSAAAIGSCLLWASLLQAQPQPPLQAAVSNSVGMQMQELPAGKYRMGAGVFEVDVPVSTDLILRIGYSRHGFESFQRVLLGMTAFSAVLLGAAGLALFRCG